MGWSRRGPRSGPAELGAGAALQRARPLPGEAPRPAGGWWERGRQIAVRRPRRAEGGKHPAGILIKQGLFDIGSLMLSLRAVPCTAAFG